MKHTMKCYLWERRYHKERTTEFSSIYQRSKHLNVPNDILLEDERDGCKCHET